MGRVSRKGKKQTVIKAHKDVGNEREENFRASKRRGRPQKPLKDDFEDEEIEKIANGDENGKSNMTNKSSKGGIVVENGTNKRKRSSQDSIKEEHGLDSKSSIKDSIKSEGFRQNGSRRKSKPRRAAEVGVGCK